ncbi:MAG: hypothetical protein ACK5JO_16295, partial [Halodesulfovibrio sp.]
MKDVIQASIEQMEAAVVALEDKASGPENVSNVLSMLGLSHLKLPSAQLITLFDMLKDGIQPVTPELVTSLLGICEAHKRLLYALGGFVSKRAEEIEAKAAALAAAGPAVAAAKECVGEEPCEDFIDDSDEGAGEAASAAGSGADAERAEGGAEQDDAAAQARTAEAGKAAQDAANGNAPARGKREGIFSVRVNTEKLDNLIDWVGKLMVSY